MKRLLLRPFLLVCLCVAAAFLGLACDSATPVAPAGTTLTLSAFPSQIALNGSATITVVGRKPDGNPLNEGTEIRLSTSRGTIDPLVAVDKDGIARGTLRADGRTGTATVQATTGDGSVTASVDVQIGQSPDSQPELILSASPSSIPVQGTSQITVIARNPDGSAVSSGQTVILTTTLGTLNPDRPRTRSDGTAVSTLAGGDQSGTATITAVLGSSAPATTQVTIRDAATDMSLQASPQTIPDATTEIDLTAFVTNAQGQGLQGAPVTFQAERGTLSETGVAFTNTNGVATNTLTVPEGRIAPGDRFDVTASTPRGDGSLIVRTITITVQGGAG